ncbi:MAG: mRNA 3'-end processing factor [Halobacteriales archaeon]
MSANVRLRDGVVVEFTAGETVVLDGGHAGDTTVLSHAHGDHIVETSSAVVASDLTAALAGVRRDGGPPDTTDDPAVDLVNAGHVAGSRAARLSGRATDHTVLYTGDCSTRDRFYLEGFDPVDADELVIEATYGKPGYRFPPTETVVARIHDWLADTMDQVVVLFGYALGRAQKLLYLLGDSPRRRVFATDGIRALNDVIASHRDVGFDSRPFDGDVDLAPGDALVLPMQTARRDRVESLIETNDAATAGFSGWAVDDSFVYRRGVDEGFVLSDHCDFDELLAVVRSVDPNRVYTHHGAAETFAQQIVAKLGYQARALKRNQSTLGEF